MCTHAQSIGNANVRGGEWRCLACGLVLGGHVLKMRDHVNGRLTRRVRVVWMPDVGPRRRRHRRGRK